MKSFNIVLFSFLLLFPFILNSQTFNTVSSGDIESASTWQNGEVPPFNIVSNDVIEIPFGVILNVTDDLSTSRNEVVNRGEISLTEDTPVVNWRNFGNMTLNSPGSVSYTHLTLPTICSV